MVAPASTLIDAISACRVCVAAGYRVWPPPIVAGSTAARLMVVGQAPGKVEASETGRPFSGPAGQRLFRWLAEAGWVEDEFRCVNYMTAITKCYPGPHPSGRGDRVPSRSEQMLCQPWLEQELARIRPAVVVPVGGLAIGRFLKPARLEDFIGRVFSRPLDDEAISSWAGLVLAPHAVVVPLPHPSGASQWFNQAGNQVRLAHALDHLRVLRLELLLQ
jgi:uracil-DNA glycosylase